jgi:uncharacterized membrane protein
MEYGIGFIVIIILIIVITPIIIASRINSKLYDIKDELERLKIIIKDLKPLIKTEKFIETEIEKTESPIIEMQQTALTPSSVLPNIKLAEQIIQEPIIPILENQLSKVIIEKPLLEMEEEHELVANTNVNNTTTTFTENEIQNTKSIIDEVPENKKVVYDNSANPESASGFNMEQFIGEKLVSIVGIAILVLGIFFSVKWAIDKELISNAGKVMIGLVSGTILIAVAHKLIKNYRAFSSILVGGGLAVFYFSIYSAFQSYDLIGQVPAFAIMIVITILGTFLATIYDKKELAIIALLGGFCTPFLISTGAGNYKILFSYLLILNIGMFVLAYLKNWKIVNTISYIATYLIFLVWLGNKYNPALGHHIGAFIFATLFYFIFFGANVIYNIKHGTKIAAQEVSLLLSNACFYFGIGMMCLHSFEPINYKGFFTIALATINFAFAYLFYKNNKIDKNIIYLLIGLVLTFVSITGPIQLHGNYITLFWAAEIIILYVLGSKTNLIVLKNASIGIVIITCISLVMDWCKNYYSLQIYHMPVILNKALITSMVVITAVFLKQKLVRQDQLEKLFYNNIPTKLYAKILSVLVLLVINIAGLLEIIYQCNYYFSGSPLVQIIGWTFEYIFIIILAIYFIKSKNTEAIKPILVCSSIFLLLYPLVNLSITEMHKLFLLGTNTKGYLQLYLLLPIAALILLAILLLFLVPYYKHSKQNTNRLYWAAIAIGLFIISTWSVHIWVWANYEDGFNLPAITRKGVKVVLPILWSITSLVLMLQGMRRKITTLRIAALTIFAATISKLFVYDISNMGQGAKIAAFVILGVILLLVSFMYQKIKNLFTDNSSKNNA